MNQLETNIAYSKFLDDARSLGALDRAPDWKAGGRAHNWRGYVGERTRSIWGDLTEHQRACIALDADAMASNEDWE